MGRVTILSGRNPIGTLFEAGSLVGLTDRELLERFLAGESAEAAFEILVDRHGPMVRSVCRSLLGDPHEADDAFQATFLVLARRASSIRGRDAVGSWLYRVARRVAAHARADAARRRLLERYLAGRGCVESTDDDPTREPMPGVLEEVDRLPERYRAPIVLCYLEGRTHEQAARTLGCPLRTVETRLQRGKARLRHRLLRRGLAPAAGWLAAGVGSSDAAMSMRGDSLPAALSGTTTRASIRFAAARASDLASTELALARAVLRNLLWNRLRRAAGAAIGLAMALAIAVKFFAFTAAGQKPDKPPIKIAGRILDDQGRPIQGAAVWMPVRGDDRPQTTPHATSDARGQYVLSVPDSWSRLPIHERQWIVWAYARGRRIAMANAWYALSGKPQSVDLTAGPATDTSFLVVGPDGRAVAGAVVEPDLIYAPNNCYINPPAAMLPAIRSVTDATGRATLPAIARQGFMSVKVTAASAGTQTFRLRDGRGGEVVPGPGPTPTPGSQADRLLALAAESGQREIRLRPAGRLEGRVEAARPELTRGVRIYVLTTGPSEPPGQDGDRVHGVAEVTTGDDGRFVVPAIAEGKLEVFPRPDPSSPVRSRPIGDLEVRRNQTTKFAVFLQKAVRLRGLIRVKGSGEPVAGASIVVSYGSSDAREDEKGDPAGVTTVVSDAKGRFETYGLPGGAGSGITALPEPFVMPAGPVEERRHRVPDGAATFDLPPLEVARGITITGRLVDSEDRPIGGAQVEATDGINIHTFAATDRGGDFTMAGLLPGVKLSYRITATPQDPQVDAEIARENPLLLRALIKTPKK